MVDIAGGAEGDLLDGTDFDDTITGGGGDDSVTGLLGADLVFGGIGDDRITGMSGEADTLHGDQGNDAIQAASAGSVFYGAAGALDPGLLAFGAATVATGQFVLRQDAAANRSHLVWDSDGTSGTAAEWGFADFTGQVGLQASDILIY